VLASVHEELCAEREKRRDADEGKKAAVDLARSLSAQNDAMREEIERLNMVLRRLDVSTAASSEDARGMAAMFKGMAAEAEAYAAAKEEEEAQQQAREDEIDTERMVPLSAVDGSASGAPSAADSAKEKDDAEFQALQLNFMDMQYDDLFESLEAREADLTLLLLRASWLRVHHQEAEREALLPARGVAVPEEARVSPAELRARFDAAPGCKGYRKVDLPFITVAQFWRAHEHPDPEENVLQGVIQYLQAHWEEFTERDVGIWLDLARPEDGGTDAIFWMVTSRARSKMAEAQHDAYMETLARRQASGEGGASTSASAGASASARAAASAKSANAPPDARGPSPGPQSAPGVPAVSGWSSARSISSAESLSHSKASSHGQEDVL